MKLLLAVTVVVLGMVAAIGGSYLLAAHAISKSDQQWCTTLELLTKTVVKPPTNPKANPSRVADYMFYLHLKELERDFGC